MKTRTNQQFLRKQLLKQHQEEKQKTKTKHLPKLDLLGGESILLGMPLLGGPLRGERSRGPRDDIGGPREESLNILRELTIGGEGGPLPLKVGGEKCPGGPPLPDGRNLPGGPPRNELKISG